MFRVVTIPNIHVWFWFIRGLGNLILVSDSYLYWTRYVATKNQSVAELIV